MQLVLILLFCWSPLLQNIILSQMAGDCRFDCNHHFIYSYPCLLFSYIAFTRLCKVSKTLNFLFQFTEKWIALNLVWPFFCQMQWNMILRCLHLSLNRLIVAARLVRVLLFIRIVTEKDQLERATRRMVRTCMGFGNVFLRSFCLLWCGTLQYKPLTCHVRSVLLLPNSGSTR